MRLSTRNQLPGAVESVTAGEAMAVVTVRVHRCAHRPHPPLLPWSAKSG